MMGNDEMRCDVLLENSRKTTRRGAFEFFTEGIDEGKDAENKKLPYFQKDVVWKIIEPRKKARWMFADELTADQHRPKKTQFLHSRKRLLVLYFVLHLRFKVVHHFVASFTGIVSNRI